MSKMTNPGEKLGAAKKVQSSTSALLAKSYSSSGKEDESTVTNGEHSGSKAEKHNVNILFLLTWKLSRRLTEK